MGEPPPRTWETAMPREIQIAGRKIGPDHPPYVICELSGNHNGSLERALR